MAACVAVVLHRLRPAAYARRRDALIAGLQLLSQGGPGGWAIYYSLLGAPASARATEAAAWAVLAFGFIFFVNKPWPLPLDAQLATSAALLPLALYHNARGCDTPLMAAPAARGVTRRAFAVLAALLPGPFGAQMRLAPRAECVCVVNFLLVAGGMVLPTALLAAREAAAYAAFCRCTGYKPDAPRRRLQHRLYAAARAPRWRRAQAAAAAALALRAGWVAAVALMAAPDSN